MKKKPLQIAEVLFTYDFKKGTVSKYVGESLNYYSLKAKKIHTLKKKGSAFVSGKKPFSLQI